MEVAKGFNGQAIKVHNLPSAVFQDYTQFQSVSHTHSTAAHTWNHKGTNGFAFEVVRGRQMTSPFFRSPMMRTLVLFPGWFFAALVAATLAPSASCTHSGRRVATLAPLRRRRRNRSALPRAPRQDGRGHAGHDRQKHLAGIVTLVARKGKVVQHKAYGFQDLEKQTPMKLDTIARIYSMTKPVTGVAMMMLYEEGKWQPSDPIARHIPEFANLKVYAGEKDGSRSSRPGASADDGRADVA